MSDVEFTSFLAQSLSQIGHALVDGGIAYVCMDWRHMEHVLDAAANAGLTLINLCVWDKGVGGMGSSPDRSQHELICVLKKGKAAHQNNIQLGRNGRNRSNVWAYKGVVGFGADKTREREMHPTVKPVAMIKDALLDASGKGDLVLDLFGGSGSTLIAAERTGRVGRMVGARSEVRRRDHPPLGGPHRRGGHPRSTRTFVQDVELRSAARLF